MKNPFSSFFNKRKDIEFVDAKRMSYLNHTVQRACDVRTTTYDTQLKKYGKHVMPKCPGILDYAQYGYIIPAWVDIHIMANKAGVTWYIGDRGPRGDRGFDNGVRMEAHFVDGAFDFADGIDPTAIMFPSPWKIFTNKNISAMLMPPVYHAKYLDDLHVVPGIVDYKDFSVVNFICMPKRECHVHIKAGEPLLHIMPFVNKQISAAYGPATEEQVDSTMNQIPGDDKQYYRKYMAVKKQFKINNKENEE